MVHTVCGPLWCVPGEVVCREETLVGGKLWLTNYRLVFISESTWTIILNLIAKVEIADLCCLRMTTKLGLSIICAFETEASCEQWLDHITSLCCDKPELCEDSFACHFRSNLHDRISCHPFLFRTTKLLCGINDPSARLFPELVCREYKRMGFGSVWRVTEVNHRFKICSSYPEYHIVPSDILDCSIAKIAGFRTHKRFPSVVWRSQTTGAVLIRCAEPRVGLMCNRNEQDEQFLLSVSKSCRKNPGLISPDGPKRLLIVDARTFRVAQLKRLWGGGSEYSDYYDEAEICYMDMPNLYAVRLSFERLTLLYAMDSDANWFSALERTGWLSYISQLLKSSTDIASALALSGRPVMVHCTDGWDRTAQLSSLAQLLADPYYRTIEGFRVLIEREWLHFGHKFADRRSGDEQSPIFLQWLDCVHQVRRQFPNHFEFNETFLIKLAIHVYSGLFGTFLCNSERERQETMVATRTCSIWGLLSRSYNPIIVNHFYEPAEQRRLLEPQWRLPCLCLWNALYRSALLSSSRVLPGVVLLNKPPSGLTSSSDNPGVPNDHPGAINQSAVQSDLELCVTATSKQTLAENSLTLAMNPIDPVSAVCADKENILHSEFDSPAERSFTIGDLLNTTDPNAAWQCTNTTDTIFDLHHDTCERLNGHDCLPVKNGGSFIASPFGSNVAILPLSSVDDNTTNPLSLKLITNNSSSTNLSTMVAELQSSTVGSLHNVHSYERLLRCKCLSPCLRNSSLSTDEGGSVFIVDEEMDNPMRSESHALVERPPLSDDDDNDGRAKWDAADDEEVPRIDLVTSPILITCKSGSMDCLPTCACECCPETGICASGNRKSPGYKHGTAHEFHSLITDEAPVDFHCSHTACSTPGVRRQKRSDSLGEVINHSEPEKPDCASDYTMHSLPEGELLLINGTATGYEEECQPLSSASSIHSVAFRLMLKCCGSQEMDTADPKSLSFWNDVYFSTQNHSTSMRTNGCASSVTDTGHSTVATSCDSTKILSHTKSCIPGNLSSSSCSPSSSTSTATNVRPVSAPISPTITSDSCHGPMGGDKQSISRPSHSLFSSVLTMCPDGSACSGARSKNDPTVPASLDWDGLPSFVDPTSHCCAHTRQLEEQAYLRKRVFELTAELAATRVQLEQSTAELEQLRRIVKDTPPSLDSSTISGLSRRPASPKVLDSGSRDSNPHADFHVNGICYEPPLTEVKDSVKQLQTTTIHDGRRYSNSSNVSSFELVDHGHPSLMTPFQITKSLQEEYELKSPSTLSYRYSPNISCTESPLEHPAIPVGSRLYRPNSHNSVTEKHPIVLCGFQSDVPNGLSDAIDQIQSTSDQAQHPLPSAHFLPPLSQPHGSLLAASLQSPHSSVGLLSTLSVGHLAHTTISNTQSSRCRSAGATRSNPSPATPDGVAQA